MKKWLLILTPWQKRWAERLVAFLMIANNRTPRWCLLSNRRPNELRILCAWHTKIPQWAQTRKHPSNVHLFLLPRLEPQNRGRNANENRTPSSYIGASNTLMGDMPGPPLVVLAPPPPRLFPCPARPPLFELLVLPALWEDRAELDTLPTPPALPPELTPAGPCMGGAGGILSLRLCKDALRASCISGNSRASCPRV